MMQMVNLAALEGKARKEKAIKPRKCCGQTMQLVVALHSKADNPIHEWKCAACGVRKAALK